MTMKKAAILIIIASAAVCFAAAAHAVTDHMRSPKRVHVVTKAEHRQDVDLLNQLRAGLAHSPIASITVGAPPAAFDQSPGSVWITYKINNDPNAPEQALFGYWQGLVLSGLFADLSNKRGLPPLYGHSFVLIAPDGTETPDSSSVIIPSPSTVSPGSEGLIRAALAHGAAAARGHAAVKDVTFDHPGGSLTPRVDVTVDDPKTFLADRAVNVYSIVSQVNDPKGPLAEGVFVVVRDPAGRLVTASGYSNRTRQGGGVDGPDYAGDSGGASLGG